jgi:hypothetical protein
MPRYRLIAAAVIDDAYLAPGAEIEFDGIPGRHMQPLDKAGKEVPAPAPLDPLYLSYRQDRSVTGYPGIFTGFSGFPPGTEETASAEPPENVDVPYVSQQGDLLNCTLGNWTGEPTSYAYQWVRDGEINIGSGATPYIVTGADVGHEVTCVVTATNAAGSTAAPPSNAVTVASPVTRR